MQMTPHSYNVTICKASTCDTLLHNYYGGSAMNISISNLISDTQYSVTIAAVIDRPDSVTGDKTTLQSYPTALQVNTGRRGWKVIHDSSLCWIAANVYLFLCMIIHVGIFSPSQHSQCLSKICHHSSSTLWSFWSSCLWLRPSGFFAVSWKETKLFSCVRQLTQWNSPHDEHTCQIYIF